MLCNQADQCFSHDYPNGIPRCGNPSKAASPLPAIMHTSVVELCGAAAHIGRPHAFRTCERRWNWLVIRTCDQTVRRVWSISKSKVFCCNPGG